MTHYYGLQVDSAARRLERRERQLAMMRFDALVVAAILLLAVCVRLASDVVGSVP